ncbi:MAG: murein L,D-transpeptidase, partial [Clostridia bacterium]|nr:murein L,D-transpeptidase [Clostridia bacterium]
RAREEDALRASAGIAPDADVSSQLTIEVNGIADPILLDDFYSASFPAIPKQMQSGSKGDDVVRLQRRLNGLEYFFGTLDGDYGAQTAEAVTTFQKQHGLAKTGVADEQTMRVLFSGEAKKALKPYMLKVSTKDQRVYAYALDDNNEYTVLVHTMKCSTGKDATPTPKGTYQATTGPGARWHYFKKYECWAQYAYYIEGDIMFHSVLYGEKDGPVTRSSVNNLGRKASHGCVRLSVEDAKWIYYNCPMKTKIVVY